MTNKGLSLGEIQSTRLQSFQQQKKLHWCIYVAIVHCNLELILEGMGK